jgi:DNA-binding response OmpR family regulator
MAGTAIAQGKSQRKVLVVEDDQAVRLFIKLALEDEGFQTEAFGDGQVALEWASDHKPSLVILDYRLPVVNGPMVAAGVRARYGEYLPIILITADPRPFEKGKQLGANVSFSKPFDLSALLNAVERLLSTT